jgi:5-methylcytosine-specific restriction enzyme subunit McrC
MRTTDNNHGRLVSELGFNPENEDDILFIANRTIKDLAEEDKLLIFPYSLNAEYKDLEAKDHVFSLHPKSVGEYELRTGNLMGFIGRNNTQLTISSRFYPENDDLFLHYLLHKVFAINVFDLKHKTAKDSVWDFLLYLFPYYLKQALNQGLFKEYQRRQYNDANVKGSIDVARHIRINNPFMGKIAYHTREHSYDNNITQLIRHTIEYIRMHKFGGGILFNDIDTQNAVNQIIYATSTYEKNNRRNIINQNIRPLNHPYFTEYALLQKICLQILRQEGLTYGNEKDKVYGLLFDGAWLWEEYLNIILKGKGFIHPENKIQTHKDWIFKNIEGHNKQEIYPDFIMKNKDNTASVIADAKYKHIDTHDDEYGRNDFFQIITYMYRYNCKKGYLLFPYDKKSEEPYIEKLEILGNLNGKIIEYGLQIPKNDSFINFCTIMKNDVEAKFLEIFN